MASLFFCRPPHGGRGLKWEQDAHAGRDRESSPSRGTWIEIGFFNGCALRLGVVPLTGDVD